MIQIRWILFVIGMEYMKNKKHVFVVGAGFSAPAKLPIQDRILREMTQAPASDIFAYSPEPESAKFLWAYINVGLYLLQNYSCINCDDSLNEYDDCEQLYRKNDTAELSNELYKRLQLLKEQIRKTFDESGIQISLEDVFTSFDKSYQSKEYFHQYSYHMTDSVKENITRLFVYYFCRCEKSHTFDAQDYIDFCKYIIKSNNVSVVSTNWDALLEEYFDRQNIKYNLCLNEAYFIENGAKKNKSIKNYVNLIKLHGSINWFKCLNCGTINIVDHAVCGNYLFNDESTEKCYQCNKECADGVLLQSQIITPTMMKSISSQLYSNLWAAARRDLREAGQVTFIGYSLPLADYELRYLLQQAIPFGIPIDIVLHNNDDPTQANKECLKSLLPEKRYRDLFIKNDLHFFYNGFGEYFKGKLKE